MGSMPESEYVAGFQFTCFWGLQADLWDLVIRVPVGSDAAAAPENREYLWVSPKPRRVLDELLRWRTAMRKFGQ